MNSIPQSLVAHCHADCKIPCVSLVVKFHSFISSLWSGSFCVFIFVVAKVVLFPDLESVLYNVIV